MERKNSLVIGVRTRQNILEGKVVRKLKDGCDNFEDYWTDSDGESSTVSKSSILSSELPDEMSNVQSSNFSSASHFKENRYSQLKSKTVHSPLKSTALRSPLKSASVNSPLKSTAVHSPLKSKAVHSPLKSKRMLSDHTVNADGVENVNKETFATEFENITVNLGVYNNPETEALNKTSDNIARNKLPKVSLAETQEIFNTTNPISCTYNSVVAEIQEIHSLNNSPLSHTYNKSELCVSKISFKNSKKSISRTTKPDPKTKKSQSQFDELDEKIMQMIHTNDEENERISNSSEEEMSLTKENSSFIEQKKEESKVKEHTIKVSGNIDDKENFSDDESLNESIKRNSKSLNKSVNDSESLSYENIYIKKTKGSSKHENDKQKTNLQEKYFAHSKSTGEKTVVSGTSQLKKTSSDIFILKKALIAKNTHTTDISVNSREYLSHSESDIDTGETQADTLSAVSKNSLSDNSLNTHVNSSGNTNDVINSDTVSSSKNTRKQEKNNAQKRKILADQHSSKNAMPQKSLPSYTGSNSFLKKSKLYKKDNLSKSKVAVEIESNNANIDDVSKSTSGDTSNMDDNNNTSEVYMIQKEKITNNNRDFILDENNFSATSFNESSHFQTFKRRRTFVNKSSISTPEGNDDGTSMKVSEDSVSVSEVNMGKPDKSQKKNENDKNRQSETHRKSCFIPYEDIETADLDNLSKLQTSTRRRTRNRSITENDVANTSMNFSEISVNVSKVNKEKTTKKQGENKNYKKRQKERKKKSCLIPHESIVEIADLDNYSQLHTCKRQRTRNSSITEENNFANMSLNYSKNSVNNVSGINRKKTNKKGRIEKNKNRQKSALNESIFLSDNDIVERGDLSLSHLQTLENSSHHNSFNIVKTSKKHRTNKNCKSIDAQKTPDSSQQQTIRQKTSVNAKNNFISEENYHADTTMNSSDNCSANNVSVINKNTTTKRPKKTGSDKSRPLEDECDIEDKNQSKAQASGKSKSNVTKNNINKENAESNQTCIRRSTRERFAPLARWRNERLCYGFRDGNIETFGIDKGTNEDTDFLKSLYKNKKQKQKIRKPKALSILDVVENKKKHVHLHKKFPLIHWDSPLRCKTEQNPSYAFLIKRMLETKSNSFGYVHIDANKTKPPQYMPEEDLLLTAIEGTVEINLQDKVYILEKKDMFIVPRGIAYNIANISKKRALLSYVVGKFKFLDDF